MTKTQVLYKGKIITLEQLMAILKKEFSKHIGFENGINIVELLEKHYEDYEEWSVWKKYTYIDILKKAICLLRRKGIIFIINKKGVYFVLKTKDEADYYKNILKRDIVAMKNSIIKADRWVENKKWRNL